MTPATRAAFGRTPVAPPGPANVCPLLLLPYFHTFIRSTPRSLVNESLRVAMNRLHPPGVAASLDARPAEAAGHQLSHGEFPGMALQDELLVRGRRRVNGRVKAAGSRGLKTQLKTLDEFDFGLTPPSIKRKQVFDPAAGRHVCGGRDVLLTGPPGTLDRFMPGARVIAITGRS